MLDLLEMAELSLRTLQEITNAIAPGCELVHSWPLAGGLSARATGLEVRHQGQTKKWILRRPHDAAYEFRVLQLLHKRSFPTPTPLHLDTTKAHCPEALMVVEYFENGPDFSPRDLTSTVKQMAETLAKLHAIELTAEELAFLLPKTAKLPARPAILDHSLEEEQLRQLLEPIWPLPRINRTVLVHGDFWPGNILWENGLLLATIDWENSGTCDPLFDLAITRLDILFLFGKEALAPFTERYLELTGINTSSLAHWELFAALRPASRIALWASVYPLLGRPDVTEASMRERLASFRENAFRLAQ